MKKKQLISALDQLDTFKDSKLYLEQYATGSELGSEILLTINKDVGFEDTFVGDLGCGCGVLMIGASLLGCRCAFLNNAHILGNIPNTVTSRILTKTGVNRRVESEKFLKIV